MNTESRELSPFNIKSSVLKLDFFSLQDTQHLISDYCSEYSVKVSDDVVNALFEYTSGYIYILISI